ncbi:MAG: winged helix DNA-binding domain-containing protein [Deinococcota bacterium]|nr:winged helix DNA-binding domain-containing protein [Deinococcota bacterium]
MRKPKALELSKPDARRLLTHHHFRLGTAHEVLERLGSVQFDPLSPVGRNHDLVLQARVPGYRVGDWQTLAYGERFLYDAWDKQASLVLMRDWPLRRIYHRWHRLWWEERIFQSYPEAVVAVLDELRLRGPLTSSAFDYQVHKAEWQGSWYGPKLTKHVLRALWHTGEVLTAGRKHGHHVYDLAERIVPAELRRAPSPSDEESVAWLLKLRHRAVGLLRPNASFEVWSMGLPAAARREAMARLVAAGELVPVEVEGVRFHALPEMLAELDAAEPAKRMVFVAPLDQLMWDRKAVRHLFGFDYVWEVYVPEPKRRWGYYVLPVLYGDRFVARVDSRLVGKSWTVHGWWWEEGVSVDAGLLAALEAAARRFLGYLGAEGVVVAEELEPRVRRALERAVKSLR